MLPNSLFKDVLSLTLHFVFYYEIPIPILFLLEIQEHVRIC